MFHFEPVFVGCIDPLDAGLAIRLYNNLNISASSRMKSPESGYPAAFSQNSVFALPSIYETAVKDQSSIRKEFHDPLKCDLSRMRSTIFGSRKSGCRLALEQELSDVKAVDSDIVEAPTGCFTIPAAVVVSVFQMQRE